MLRGDSPQTIRKQVIGTGPYIVVVYVYSVYSEDIETTHHFTSKEARDNYVEFARQYGVVIKEIREDATL